jgi:hypothetical protein
VIVDQRHAVAVGGLLMALAVACTSSPSPVPSSTAVPSPSPSASGFPAGCAPIELVSPKGDGVDLTGEWTGTEWFAESSGEERTSIQQLGDCVWITITDASYRENPDDESAILGSLFGRVTSDFVLAGDLVTVRASDEDPAFAPIRLTVGFNEDGTTRLREEREAGVSGPRCEDEGSCPGPVELSRVADVQVESVDFEPPFTALPQPGWGFDPNSFNDTEIKGGYLEFRDNLVVMAANCDLVPEPGVGPGATDHVHALAEREGLATSDVTAVEVGGLPGFQLDFAVDPTWRGSCPKIIPFEEGVVPVHVDSSAGFFVAMPGGQYRLISLDAPGGGTVTIMIFTEPGTDFEPYLADAMAIVDTVRFDISR